MRDKVAALTRDFPVYPLILLGRIDGSPADPRDALPVLQHDDTQVVETRESDEGDVDPAPPQVPECDKRFTTYERAETRDAGGGQEGRQARRVRPRQAARIDAAGAAQAPGAAASRSTRRSSASRTSCCSSAQREVKSEKLGELVMRELKRIDKVAYVRFASVYRSFEDVDEFAESGEGSPAHAPPARLSPSRRRAETSPPHPLETASHVAQIRPVQIFCAPRSAK